jgi:hypothetical protein
MTRQLAESAQDALAAFAEAHLCICEGTEKEVERRQSAALQELSAKFSARFVDVYSRYATRSGDGSLLVPWAWKTALTLYRRMPRNYVAVMASMAAAHIAVDLLDVLCEMDQEVSEDEYNSVNQYIWTCLDAIGEKYAKRVVSEEVWKKVQKILVPLAASTTVASRTLVYDIAQERRLAQAEAKRAGK